MNKTISFALVMWLTTICVSYCILLSESTSPTSLETQSLAMFPAASASPIASSSANVGLDVNRHATIKMFVHPMCPCTRSSLHELERLLAKSPEPVNAVVYFALSKDAPKEWSNSDSVRIAMKIPNLQIEWDIDGREASRYGAVASGHVVLLDSQGQLLFHGGITSERGHEGESLGSAKILSHLRGGSETPNSAPVFGCVIGSTR